MELSDVPATLRAYPGHVRDVLTFDDLEQYRRIGEPDGDLILYAALGLALTAVVGAVRSAWVDRLARRLADRQLFTMSQFGLARLQSVRPNGLSAVHQIQVHVMMLVLLPAFAGILHVTLLGYHRLYHPDDIGGFADTLNALLAVAAAAVPANAITGFVERAAESIVQVRYTRARAVAYLVITTLLSLLPRLYVGVAVLHVIASMHGISTLYLLPPLLALSLLFIPLIWVTERRSLQTGR